MGVPVEVKSVERRGIVGRRGGIELDGEVQGIEPLRERMEFALHLPESLGTRDAPRFQVVESVRFHQGFGVLRERRQAVVEKEVGPGHGTAGAQPQLRPRDDPELAQARAGHVEDLPILRQTALHPIPGAGDHLQLQGVVPLRSVAVGGHP